MAKYHGGAPERGEKGSSGNRKAHPGPKGGVFYEGFAGMPEEAVQEAYPNAKYSGPQAYSDSREGLDMLAKNNHDMMMKKLGGRHTRN